MRVCEREKTREKAIKWCTRYSYPSYPLHNNCSFTYVENGNDSPVKLSNYGSKQHVMPHRFVVLQLRNQVIYPAGSAPSHDIPSCTVPAQLQLRVGKATAVHEPGTHGALSIENQSGSSLYNTPSQHYANPSICGEHTRPMRMTFSLHEAKLSFPLLCTTYSNSLCRRTIQRKLLVLIHSRSIDCGVQNSRCWSQSPTRTRACTHTSLHSLNISRVAHC